MKSGSIGIVGLVLVSALFAGCGSGEPVREEKVDGRASDRSKARLTALGIAEQSTDKASDRQRIWVGSSGSLKIEGEFVGFADGILELRTTADLVTKIPIDELAPADGRIAQALATSRGRTTRENTGSALRAFRTPFGLNLSSTTIADDGVAILEELISLESLDLSDTKVTDTGLVHLAGLADLWSLGLRKTVVTDAGLVHLKGLTRLTELSLGGTKVTDAGLVHLEGLTELEGLWLEDTKITDAGLAHLKGMTRLKRLDLRDTEVTVAGVRKLQAALLMCAIAR